MQGRFVSYLDLMCCGFGGALLMFLIVSMAQEQRHPTDQLLLVRAYAAPVEQGSPQPKGEIGIEYRRVGESNWLRAGDQSAAPPAGYERPLFFTAAMEGNSGSEAVLLWRRPPSGAWEFQPFLADSPFLTTPPGNPSEGVEVTLEIRTRDGTTTSESPDVLRWPGQWGKTVQVQLPESLE